MQVVFRMHPFRYLFVKFFSLVPDLGFLHNVRFQATTIVGVRPLKQQVNLVGCNDGWVP